MAMLLKVKIAANSQPMIDEIYKHIGISSSPLNAFWQMDVSGSNRFTSRNPDRIMKFWIELKANGAVIEAGIQPGKQKYLSREDFH